MKSVKIREIAEALRCVRFDSFDVSMTGQLYFSATQAELLAELAIRAMVTPTEEMLRVGDVAAADDGNEDLSKAELKNIWEAMCQEAMR